VVPAVVVTVAVAPPDPVVVPATVPTPLLVVPVVLPWPEPLPEPGPMLEPLHAAVIKAASSKQVELLRVVVCFMVHPREL
jgi:hypothetical protein